MIIFLIGDLFRAERLLSRRYSWSTVMTARLNDNVGDATILLFGPQALSFNKRSLEKLRSMLSDGPARRWMLDTVAELPSYWDALTRKIPNMVDTNPGVKLLADLELWLREGLKDEQKDMVDLPNMVLTPLVVLTQLTQYWRYLELSQMENEIGRNKSQIDLQADLFTRRNLENKNFETLGFCTGLLSAFAVASSSNQEGFERYGAVAVRLSMLVGALVDAHEVWNKELGRGKSKSYATAWRTPTQGEDMQRIVDDLFPEAYVSVLYDEARATITTSERTASLMLQQLRAAGVTAAEVGLKGHFHSPNEATSRTTEALIELCDSLPGLQFPDATDLALPSYTNTASGESIGPGAGKMHEIALRAILIQQCNWYGTFSAVQAARLKGLGHCHDNGLVVSFGPDRCVPPTLMRRLGPRLVHFTDLDEDTPQLSASVLDPEAHSQRRCQYDNTATQQQSNTGPALVDEDAVAVVGMSIKVAGADDLDEFSQMLRTGESQHELISPDRLMFDTLFREGDKNPSRKWYGNFIRDTDAFDHKFFKRSPRESSTMDPQQRLFLQAAYQAVEQSGYFTETAPNDGRDKRHVGVYLGACAGDYEHHVACHGANAFTATGNLKSFIPGKVSHYFGWTGPAMTFDTACSASAVAIHTACRNLLSGECTAALAGGVAVMTNFLWFQNLAGASFLSPTGQCKPFDELADGYCRAEGIACVFLKKMSDAIADGNHILGCIASTAVYQNQNCTPLFVPNEPSLSQLFKDVIQKAKVTPRDVSLVEAHGTGTPVGDPAEYDSIRVALGGPIRPEPLPIGSIKGHIGHTEGASGVISLIKIMVMMQEAYIPPQASFSKMSHHINVTPSDMMEVVTSLRPWSEEYKVALINNYGASGSNASMVLTQSPHNSSGLASAPIHSNADLDRFPFWIAGLDTRSITAYSDKLLSFLRARPKLTLADISFNMNRQSNRSLAQGFIFSSRSVAELSEQLSEAASAPNPAELGIVAVKSERPVILCFGGQVSTFVGLDQKLYDSVSILRHYLDQCDAVIRSLGSSSIYPEIFSREPVQDTVKLQTMLFAMQYACAKCWIDCGLSNKIVAVVGHSFGEITALCVSGIVSLRDTIKLVVGRARLVRDAWGPDPGAMMAVEADEELVHELLTEANGAYGGDRPVGIACYNGPRSFTLAGSIRAIDTASETMLANRRFSGIKSKKLNVTNAFHSILVEPLLDGLEQVGNSIIFNEAVIPFERATETKSAGKLTFKFVPEHMRKPVFFNHAVQRLAKEYPSAIFLEAGSSSTITIMASRALAGQTTPESHYFQALSITAGKGLDGLTDATVSLWKQGLRVAFWAHHALQTYEYATLQLPPYQFEKARHWLELKSPAVAVAEAVANAAASGAVGAQSQIQDEQSLGLWSFNGYLDADKNNGKGGKSRPRFRINTKSDKYKAFVSGHFIVQTAPICPATLEVDMAIEALYSLHREWKEAGLLPVVHDMVNHAPICANDSRIVWLDFEALNDDQTIWGWEISSIDSATSGDPQKHVQAQIRIRSPSEAAYQAEFRRMERLVSHSRCMDMLALDLSDDSVEILQGRNVYRVFGEVVDYGELYRGVNAVVGRGDECAGRVRKRHSGETWLDVLLSDCFSQVGGIWVNCMTDCSPTDMYIAVGCEISMRSPRAVAKEGQDSPDNWHVFARHTRQSDKLYMTDVFVFDAASGTLTEVMLGIQYARVAKASMSKMLMRLTTDESVLRIKPPTRQAAKAEAPGTQPLQQDDSSGVTTKSSNAETGKKKEKKPKQSGRPDITDDVRNLVANVSGIEANEIMPDSELADFGIDSLMGMELAREVETVFKCTLDQEELMEATSLRKFVVCISNALFGPDKGGASTNTSNQDGDNEDDSSSGAAEDDTWSDTGKGESTATSTTGTESPPKPAVQEPDPNPAAHDLPATTNLKLSQSDILECFGETKMLSDKHIHEFHLDNIEQVIIAASNRLCSALVVEAFEELGCPLRTAAAGDTLDRVSYLPQHERLMKFVYEFLENDARLVDIDVMSGQLTRTHIAVPRKTSETILQDLLSAYPEFVVANRLTYYAGKNLAGVLTGKTDGIRVIFGSIEGRELVQALYCEHTFNRMNYGQMRDAIHRLVQRVQSRQPGETLKILEMGAGTGGTTYVLAPFLASLDIPVEYTFTDLSPSMVANARRKFGKQYSFMRFAVHDIEKPPADELKGQHIVIASNAIHATHNLVISGINVRSALRPDGFLMMLEMTEVVPFIDLIFGLLEGWWLFDDGRKHAIVPAEHWERDLHAAGFGHVDWTDGSLPENNFQKVMIALASGPVQERLPKPAPDPHEDKPTHSIGNVVAREEEAEKFVAKHTAGWVTPALSSSSKKKTSAHCNGAVVIVTGATGSLGSHLVAGFAEHPDVKTVVCVNRRSSTAVKIRQAEAFSSRGIELSTAAQDKLRMVETDTSKPQLGLPANEYSWLVQNGTDIVHNAWPMSGTRPIHGFEPQFQTLRNLLDLAREMACRDEEIRVGFELVSSIGVVGHSGEARVIERRVPMAVVLPIGYCEAKWTCERMLDETLHKFPDRFRTMAVRPGQIAGSKTSGFWNPVEHFAFLVKSSQALRAWPDFDGVLQWVPVNDVADTMVDLLAIGEADAPEPYPVYHIDNPIGQPWKQMSPVLADALDIPPHRIMPFRDWVKLVRRAPLHTDTENPAARLIDFLDYNFERMSCGGLILDTTKVREHSRTMAAQGPVTAEVARSYVTAWKKMGFLNA
ncbi:hypothetical protein F5Y13DRAFT_179997 [Hypoxylon sp. FL1857]|nr:hypothetical protein F5Y13DRAFT_179997 [Hypoxylon sp. FL1857]